jgi:hypothetical protein
VEEGQLSVTRTHPLVESLSRRLMETALDPLAGNGSFPARRCGVIRTWAVNRRVTLLLARYRYRIVTTDGEQEKPLLAEDCQVLASGESPQDAEWLHSGITEQLLHALPDANIASEEATDLIRRVIDGFDVLSPHLESVAIQRGQEFLDAHQRVRGASKVRNVRYRVEPQLPPDVLGVLYLSTSCLIWSE